MNKAFRFMKPDGRGFKVVVMARNLKRARQYVKDQAISVVTYRMLRYVGEGHPTNPDGWMGAVADKPNSPDWLSAPVLIPPPYYLNADGVICR